jgi:hypothetical protein
MKLRFLMFVVATALSGVAAHAQGGIYVNPIGFRITNSTPDNGPFAFLGPNGTSQLFYGVNLGTYHELAHEKRFNAGIDVRDFIVHGNGSMLTSFMVSLRLSPTTYIRGFKPYVQPTVGAGSTRAGTSSIRITKVEYGVYGGVDYSLNRHVDLRVVEASYGALTTASSATIGASATVPSARLLGFSTGLVFRIP